MVDPQLGQSQADLCGIILVDLPASLWGVEVMAAPIGVEG
jgi:hypothetical protein